MEKLLVQESQLKPNMKELLRNIKLNDQDENKDLKFIGQEKAMKALGFGLSINQPGYNVYVAGMPESGRFENTLEVAKKIADQRSTTTDIVFLHNFKNDQNPIMVKLKDGMGSYLEDEMEDFIEYARNKFYDLMETDENTKKITKDMEEKIGEIFEAQFDKYNLHEVLGDLFMIQRKGVDIVLIPIKVNDDGKRIPIKSEDYKQLSDEKKKEFDEKVEEIKPLLSRIRQEADHKIRIEEEIGAEKINDIFMDYLSEYISSIKDGIDKDEIASSDIGKLEGYFDNVKKDIEENMNDFVDALNENDDPESKKKLFLTSNERFSLDRYKVNLFIDSNESMAVPVIKPNQTTFRSLFGGVNYKKYMGEKESSHMEIEPGDLHRANEGFLILDIKEILRKPYVYSALMNVLNTGVSSVKNVTEYAGANNEASIRPEAIPVNVKVVLIGSSRIYNILLQQDESFNKQFKILAQYDYEIELDEKNINKMLQFIKKATKKHKLKKITKEAFAEILRIGSRMIGEKDKITAQLLNIENLLIEANHWATLREKELIDLEIIKETYQEQNDRLNIYEEKVIKRLKDGTYLIDLEGEKIGEINGLSVLNINGYSFGKPVKITVSTYKNNGGMNNIDKKQENTGSLHNKGIRVVTGYLGHEFGQEKTLNFNYSIVFEQMYGKLDGDSASSTELYALLSSLSNTPIKQSIAVTGSVNQRGLIQPIGGVNEKIEGFYKICKEKGMLSDETGVIIPKQNVKNLNLDDEVIEAIKEGKFKIYAIEKIEQGLEILTGEKVNETNDDGSYVEGSIFDKIEKKFTKKKKSKKNTEEEDIAEDSVV